MRRLHALFALVATLSTGACAGATAPRAAREPVAVIRHQPTPAPAPRPIRPATPDRAAVRAALAARRAHHLEVLAAYRAAGQFPHNTTVPGDGHFLIDDRGVLCAVANLIAQDGLRHLIEDASRTNNGLLFAEVADGPFNEWILASGFTREEIARIQVPAPYVGPIPEELLPVPVPEPGPRPEPAPIAVDPFIEVDMRVAAYLLGVEANLVATTDASLELAAARLTTERPDLAVALVRDTSARPAVADIRFAEPPPQ